MGLLYGMAMISNCGKRVAYGEVVKNRSCALSRRLLCEQNEERLSGRNNGGRKSPRLKLRHAFPLFIFSCTLCISCNLRRPRRREQFIRRCRGACFGKQYSPVIAIEMGVRSAPWWYQDLPGMPYSSTTAASDSIAAFSWVRSSFFMSYRAFSRPRKSSDVVVGMLLTKSMRLCI